MAKKRGKAEATNGAREARPDLLADDGAPGLSQRELTGLVRDARAISRPYRVDGSGRFRLADFDPADTGELTAEDKPRARRALERGVEALAELQDRLYAQDRWSVLLVFQALDAAGKDSAIKHVLSGLNPQGCQVASFKAPSDEELDHDYLWRCVRHLPERGRIGVFNRSHYEEVLVVRVHPGILAGQKLPPERVGKGIWTERLEDIRCFERYLARNGTVIRKFFLHVSAEEQKERFLERLEDPEKHWKFRARDVAERGFRGDYLKAYEEAIAATATPESPWYVVPADRKWYTRLVVAAAVVDALGSLGLAYPKLSATERSELAKARAALSRT
ncbi:MAG: PPK2 family polyphosphate--nucleotide phosphotransferase [Acidobacteriota bacterium]